FQAEDGIRDFHVTGVQTCALPIYLAEIVGFNTFGVQGQRLSAVSRSFDLWPSLDARLPHPCKQQMRHSLERRARLCELARLAIAVERPGGIDMGNACVDHGLAPTQSPRGSLCLYGLARMPDLEPIDIFPQVCAAPLRGVFDPAQQAPAHI